MTTFFGAGLILISMNSFSQAALKIGHVDIAEILAALPARDSAAAIIDKETKEMQSTYDEMTAVYNKMLDDYEKGQSTFTEFVKKNKETELLDKEKRLQEFEQNASANLQKRNSDLIQPILNKILRAIDKVAAENGLPMFLMLVRDRWYIPQKTARILNSLVIKVLKPLILS